MLKFIEYLDFKGINNDSLNVSGIDIIGDFILLVTDEINKIPVLKQGFNDNQYQFRGNIFLPNLEDKTDHEKEKDEIDLEDITHENNTCYVVGSHALARKSVKLDKKYKKNLKRLEEIKSASERNQILKFTFDVDKNGNIQTKVESKSLQDILKKDKVLNIFTHIPSKENGIDIEAIAVDNEQLYLGFRGPVLRANYVPVLITTFDDLSEYEIRYVNLGGRGVRGMTKVKEGFLLIGGPVGDGEQSYQLYFWDGLDTIPGKDKEQESTSKLLGEIPTPKGAKAEGIMLLKESDFEYNIVIVYDGVPQGKPTVFQVYK